MKVEEIEKFAEELTADEFFDILNKYPSTKLAEDIWLVIPNHPFVKLYVLIDALDGYYKYNIDSVEGLLEILKTYV